MTKNLNDEDLIIINDDEVIIKNQNNDLTSENYLIKSLNKRKNTDNISVDTNQVKNNISYEKTENSNQNTNFSAINMYNNDSNDENDRNLNEDAIYPKKAKVKNAPKKTISNNKKKSDINKSVEDSLENQETLKFNADAGKYIYIYNFTFLLI
jgi:hypothetical protein